MTHKRTEIKNKVAELLGDLDIPINVNKSKPSPPDNLPEINIYSGPETNEIFVESPRRYKRSFILKVDYITKTNDESSGFDNVDQVSNVIENILQINEGLDSLVLNSSHTKTDTAIDTNGSPMMAGALLEFEYEYITDVEFENAIENFNLDKSVPELQY